MTEYDYSPDAYDRYYAKLNSVARWVDKQADEAYRYTNPFLDAPSVAGSSSGSGSGTGYSSGGLREREARERSSATPPRSVSTPPVKHHSRSHSHHVSSQPPPPLPTQHPQQHPYSQPQAQRQITLHRPSASSTALVIAPAARYAQAQPQQQTHSRSLSSSVPRPHTSHASRSYSQQHQQQPQQRPQAYAYASQSQAHLPQLSTTTKHATRGSTSTGATTTQYTAAPGQPIVMTHGQRTYVVVQPTGGRVEVVSPQNTSPTSHHPQSRQPVSPTYPAAPAGYSTHYANASGYVAAAGGLNSGSSSGSNGSEKKKPFLKRLFGSSSQNQNQASQGQVQLQAYQTQGGQVYYYPQQAGYANAGYVDNKKLSKQQARRRTSSMHY